ELAGGRVRVRGPRHGDRVAIVLQAVASLVPDGASRRLLAHSRLEPAALDHEPVDDTVKHRVGVEPGLDVPEKVLGRLRGELCIELDRDDPVVRMQPDHAYLPDLTEADSMMIGFCGTFWNGPTFMVGALAICITTSMPWTTRPKTV